MGGKVEPRTIQAETAGKGAKPKWYTRAGLLDRYESLKARWRESRELARLKVSALYDPFNGRNAVRELAQRREFGKLAYVAVNSRVFANARSATYQLCWNGRENELASVALYARHAGIREIAEKLADEQAPEAEARV